LAYQVGRQRFSSDITKAKEVLEDISGREVRGFRAAGFSVLDETRWFFDVVKEAGYSYDSSVFPSGRGHGGMLSSKLQPHVVHTTHGPLVEFPQSMIVVAGQRFSVFGGGYLRLAPIWIIRKATAMLKNQGRPLIVYVHPREIDPDHPRMKLSPFRYFKCYVNLHSTKRKLDWLCMNNRFITMGDFALLEICSAEECRDSAGWP